MGYHRYYRRPYYRRRRYYQYHHDNIEFTPKGCLTVFVIIIALFSLVPILKLFSSNPSGFLFFGIFIAVIILVVKLVKKIRKEKSQFIESNSSNSEYIHEQNIAQLNSEKHGCKCYMDGLSDAEKDVAYTLSEKLDYKNYFLFNNLIIPSEHNGSTQIDHIVISKFGVFVIESKDYKGWIFGSEDQASWTQAFPGKNNKFPFQNPIRQNFAHIKALESLVPSIAENLHNIVVFSDESEIKTPRIESVLYLRELIEYIKKYTQEKLTESDVHLVIGKLSYVCQTADISSADHIANLHDAHHS